MNQNVWGPHLWFSLHTISFTYPLKPKDSDKANFKSFFNELQHVIPCSVCKKNYKRHLMEFPVDEHLHSRKDLVYWVIDLHNMVNSETGKRVLSYDEAIKRYEDAYHKKISITTEEENKNCKNGSCENDEDKNIIMSYPKSLIHFLIIVLIFLLLFYFFHLKYKISIKPR